MIGVGGQLPFVDAGEVFGLLGPGIEFGEGTPCVEAEDGLFFRDVAAGEGADLGVGGFAKKVVGRTHPLPLPKGGGLLAYWLQEMGELPCEQGFEGGEPVKAADEVGLRGAHPVRLVEDLCHLTEEVFAAGVEVALVEVVGIEVLLEGNALKIGWQTHPSPPERETQRRHWQSGDFGNADGCGRDGVEEVEGVGGRLDLSGGDTHPYPLPT